MELIYYRHHQDGAVSRLNKYTLPYYELTILFRGNMYYKINGEKLLLKPHDMLFLPPNSVRERSASNEPADFISFNFLCDENIELPMHIPDATHSLISMLTVCTDKLWSNQLNSQREKQIEHLLACIIENTQTTLLQKKDKPLVIEIKRYLFENLKNRITLEKIGKHTHFSPIYCNIVFKQETGVPIILFFTQLRIEEAKKLLLAGELSLKDIAETLGFEDYNYFARTFKKHTGKTPLEYRRQFSF